MTRSPDEGGATLFDSSARALLRPALFLTNRFNLLQILSAGYIGPRAAFSKYYSDLLELCPGRVPVVRGPIDAEMQAIVSSGQESAFPVALELDVSRVGDAAVPALTESGRAGRAALNAADIVAWAPSSVLPLSLVNRVVFRSSRELEEHRSREYENIRSDILPLAVDEALFERGSDERTLEALRGWFAELPKEGIPHEEFTRADRVSGAKCFAVAALPQAPSAADRVVELLRSVPAAGDADSVGVKTLRPSTPWLTSSAISGTEAIGRGVDLNSRLFNAATRVLQGVDRAAAWRPLEVLTEIDRVVRGRKLSKKDEVELGRNLDPIRGILRNDRDFKSFTPGVGLDVAKALLLVLLRPDPLQLLQWSPADMGADDSVTITAAVLCGLLNGREKSPATLRPAALDSLLATQSAMTLSVGRDDVALESTEHSERPVIRRESAGDSVSLMIGNQPVIRWKKARRSVEELLLELDLKLPSSHEVAIEICRVLSWKDCVRTELTIDFGEVTVTAKGKGKSLTMIIRGWPAMTQEIDPQSWRERIQTAGVPIEKRDKVRSLIPSEK